VIIERDLANEGEGDFYRSEGFGLGGEGNFW